MTYSALTSSSAVRPGRSPSGISLLPSIWHIVYSLSSRTSIKLTGCLLSISDLSSETVMTSRSFNHMHILWLKRAFISGFLGYVDAAWSVMNWSCSLADTTVPFASTVNNENKSIRLCHLPTELAIRLQNSANYYNPYFHLPQDLQKTSVSLYANQSIRHSAPLNTWWIDRCFKDLRRSF